MLILSIETSCDETAVSLVEARGEFPQAVYDIHGDALWSQIDIHREYGGVLPPLGHPGHPPPHRTRVGEAQKGPGL